MVVLKMAACVAVTNAGLCLPISNIHFNASADVLNTKDIFPVTLGASLHGGNVNSAFVGRSVCDIFNDVSFLDDKRPGAHARNQVPLSNEQEVCLYFAIGSDDSSPDATGDIGMLGVGTPFSSNINNDSFDWVDNFNRIRTWCLTNKPDDGTVGDISPSFLRPCRVGHLIRDWCLTGKPENGTVEIGRAHV